MIASRIQTQPVGADILDLNVDGNIGTTNTYPYSGTGFLGFISSGQASSIVLTSTFDNAFIDIVGGSVGYSATATPEPASLMLVLLAAITLVGWSWLKYTRQ